MVQNNLYNSSRVMQAVWQNGTISRSKLSQDLGLNRSTITKLVTPIMEDGIIIPVEKTVSGHQGGRKADVLSIDENYGVVIGIEVQTSESAVCITDLKGNCLISDVVDNGGLTFIELFESIIEHAISMVKRRNYRIMGAAIGTAGVINPYEGIVYSSNPLGVKDPVKLYGKLDKFGFPILIENDANCCCAKQILPSLGVRNRNFISVLGEFRKTNRDVEQESGIAIGLGLYVKGSILHGDNFSAGEFQSLFKSANNPSQFDLDETEISKIEADDDVQRKVVRELSRNLSLLVNTLNISHIFFEGNIVDVEYMITPILRDEIQRNWNYDSQVACNITFSKDREFAVAHGAACFFLDKLFSPTPFWENRSDYYPSGYEFFKQITK